MKRLTILLAAFVLFGSTAFGQTEAQKPKMISGGVLNGKAVSLPKPAYPSSARAVNAHGAVVVQILIDEEGSVVSAAAVSGHPLLKAAAADAARGARFSPTRLQGEPVRVSGVIVYDFVGTTTLASIGFEIAFAERNGTFFPGTVPAAVAARLPDEWADEKTVLNTLTFEKADTKAPPPPASPAPMPARIVSREVTVTTVLYQTPRLTSTSMNDVRMLGAAIRTKLADDHVKEWHYRVGTALGNFAAEINNASKTDLNIGVLDQLAATVPPNVNPAISKALNELTVKARNSDGSWVAADALVSDARQLKNLPV